MRAWFVWMMGVAVYVAAVAHRTSLGVAAPQAADQFRTTTSVIAMFVVLQVAIYAAMQIPAGVLLDRFGARRILAGGAALMALGQLLLAVTDTVPLAVLARMLTGTGDAACFLTAVRLVAAWFPAHRIPVLTQLTGVIGQSGQVVSAVPLVWALHHFGWTPAFLALGAIGCVIAASAYLIVRDSPNGPLRRDSGVADRFLGQVARVVREPGTRLAMAEHGVTGSGAMAFAMMWGFPYLVTAEGVSPAAAGGLFTAMVISGVAAGPVLGYLTRTFPARRVLVVLLASLFGIVPWLAVLVWPGRAPLALLAALVIGLAIAGPASMIALDHARTYNPPERLGTASGVVVMAGFTVTLLMVLFIGIALDVASGGGTPTLGAYRVAMAAQIPLWLGCYLAVFVFSRQTRAAAVNRDR